MLSALICILGPSSVLAPLPLPPAPPGTARARPLTAEPGGCSGAAGEALLQLGSGLLISRNNDPSVEELVAEGCGTIKPGNETLGRCVFIAL